jgi:transposase
LLGNFGSKEDEMSANKFTDEFKRDLARVTEERDILKKATAYFARQSPLWRFAGKPLPGSG